MIEVGARPWPAMIDSARLVMKKPAARMAVARVSTLAVPRLVMKPPPPPMPRPPPSDFCSMITPIIARTSIRWTTIMTVCMEVPSVRAPNRPAGRRSLPLRYGVPARLVHDPGPGPHPAPEPPRRTAARLKRVRRLLQGPQVGHHVIHVLWIGQAAERHPGTRDLGLRVAQELVQGLI